jgi:hypothetical protein
MLAEVAMIELTPDQVRAVGEAREEPPTVIDPTTQKAYVLLSKDEYERLTKQDYDASGWTDEEMDALAWEAGKHAGWWEEMPQYDNYPEKS